MKLTDEEISLQLTKDSHVLDLLRECGSDLEQPHELEHFFYAPDLQTSQTMAAEAQAAGYKTSENHHIYEGRDVWGLMVFGLSLATDDAVNNESIFMLSLANKHNATYDGWGTGMLGDDVSVEDS